MQLMTGFDFFGDGYSKGEARDLTQMRIDYQAHRDEVFAGLAERVRDGRTERLRPWGFYLVELGIEPADIPRGREAELKVLSARRLLSAEERRGRGLTLAHGNGGG